MTSGVRSAIVGSLIWLVLSLAASLVIIARLGDYGSIVELLVGLGLGLTGAVSHVILSASAAFRSRGIIRRAFLNWLLGYPSFVTGALFLLNMGAKVNNPWLWTETFKFFVVYTGGPMLLLSFVVAWSTGQRRSDRVAL